MRGIYGGEAAILFGSHDQTYSYGNPFTVSDLNPTTSDFSSPKPTGGFGVIATTTTRALEQKDGFMFGFQLTGFLGIEYFLAHKVSLSAEYGWGLQYTSVGEATITTESWGTTGGAATTTDSKIGSSSAFHLDVQNATSIIFHFYF